MRNMGRLFQYNRFGDNADEHCKKDNFTRSNFKTKMQQQPTAKCPAYAELYTEYNATSKPPATADTKNPTSTTTMSSSTTSTPKSVELAIRKYQEWSSKLLPTTTTATSATAVTTAPAKSVTHLSASTARTSSSQKSSCSCTCSCACTTSSGYHSHLALLVGDVALPANDRALLVSAVKRPRVYDCMKDFLRRKLFQQHVGDVAHKQLSDTEEDVTSDYDEVDMLDSSYNADEEDATDCSSNCSYPLGQHSATAAKSPNGKANSPQKSLLSLNCWHNSASCTDSSTEEEDACNEAWAQQVTPDLLTPAADDSDAGISDCCQLISEATHSQLRRRRSIKSKRHTRFALEDDNELLASSWYQPHITTKAALEHLLSAAPGTFLVRRKSRAYELCLRVETKVKHFVVISAANNYKLKGAKKQFSSLKALVTHHSVMAEQLPLTLALPREKTQRQQCALRYADDFDTYESLQFLGLLQEYESEFY